MQPTQAAETPLAQQPQLDAKLEPLGSGHWGDVAVDFYGRSFFIGSRFDDVDLEAVVLAGTSVDLSTAVMSAGGKKEWLSLERQAREAYEDNLTGLAA